MLAPLSPAERDELVRTHLPVIGHAVSAASARLPATGTCREELVSAGIWGLVLAARSYDPRAGLGFAAVATARINQAIADDLCDRRLSSRQDSVRSPADRERAVAQARHDLASVLHRRPTDAEIAAASGVAPAAVSRPATQPMVESVATGLDELPSQSRIVMEAYYVRQLTMTQIAVELGISESRALQLRREAVAMLRHGVALI